MTYPIMTDEEAARLIKNNDTIGIGGFSSVGVPKVVPAALARYAIDEHEADMQTRLKEIDEWLRRRYRMCIWKAWKKCSTKVKNLIKCGIEKWQAYEWGNSSKKYWRVAGSGILHRAIGNEALQKQGWPCLMDYHRLIVRVQ